MFVANRRRDRALSLARRYHGTSIRLDELPTAVKYAYLSASGLVTRPLNVPAIFGHFDSSIFKRKRRSAGIALNVLRYA